MVEKSSPDRDSYTFVGMPTFYVRREEPSTLKGANSYSCSGDNYSAGRYDHIIE